jgi:hypothetical protein
MNDVKTIEKDILEEFFKRLVNQSEFPPKVIDELILLKNEGKLIDVAALEKAFREGA